MGYHIKMVKGNTEKPYQCEGYTVTTLPKEGYYHDHPEKIGMPRGQRVKFDMEVIENGELTRKVICIPKDGAVAYVMNDKGDTIDTYPKKRERVKGVESKIEKREEQSQKEQDFGLKVGVE